MKTHLLAWLTLFIWHALPASIIHSSNPIAHFAKTSWATQADDTDRCDLVILLQADTLIVCAGNAALLTTTTNTPDVTYQWTRNGVDIPNSNVNFYYATTTGDYACQISNGACTKTSESVSIVVKEAIEVKLMQIGGFLFTSNVTADAYYWHKDGQLVEDQDHFPTDYQACCSGSYHLVVEQDGCFGMSNIIVLVAEEPNPTSLVQNQLSKVIKLSPNPVTDQAYFTLSHPTNGPYQLEVLDLQGNNCLKMLGIKNKPILRQSLDMTHLPAATYFLKIQLGKLVGGKMMVKY